MTEEEMKRALFSEKEKKVIGYMKEKFEEDLDKFEADHWLPEYDNIVYEFLNNPDEMLVCLALLMVFFLGKCL